MSESLELKALALFLASLFIGAALIGTAPKFWILPLIVVVAYTLVMWKAQRDWSWLLGDVLKDSPYYLGFLLTQIALVRVFLRFDPTTDSNVEYVTTGLSLALLTSILGLVGRQVVVLTDPQASRRRSQAQLLEDQLRESISEYHDVQITFVGMVKELVEERKDLLDAERSASREYVTKMRGTITSLESAQRKLSDNLSEAAEQTSTSLRKHHQQLTTAATAGAEMLTDAADSLRSRLSALEVDIASVAERLRTSVAVLDLAPLSASASEAASALRDLQKSGTAAGQEAERAFNSVERIRHDIDSIDHLLTEFVKIAEDRIRELGRLNKSG